MRTDWLIVGAGLTGATLAERIATQRNEKVVVIDKRGHVAGNAYDEYDESGILTHRYGPHIFHTNSHEIFSYLSQFTRWRPYQHKVLGLVEGQLVPIPFNLNSIAALFPSTIGNKLITKLVDAYGHGSRVPILKMRENSDPDIQFVAEYVYRNVFENYTRKQWGISPEELSPAVTSRVPILISRDDRYFQDTFQAMPSLGYTAMVSKMLAHRNIKTFLNTSWNDVQGGIIFSKMVFTGPIDEYFEFSDGALPYRSLRFEIESKPVEQYQSAAVVNYPNDYTYTRITEQKLITGQRHHHTTILTEYPQAHEHGRTEPYYPIPTDANKAHYQRYEEQAKTLSDTVLFAGRLGDYMYYNMDQAVGRALSIVRKLP